MSVGNQPTVATVNSSVGSVAVGMRAVMARARDLQTQVTTLGTPGLEAIGFSAQDAASVVTAAGYMSTVAGCYYGTVQQGGSGGTGASDFNFDSALSAEWGFQ